MYDKFHEIPPSGKTPFKVMKKGTILLQFDKPIFQDFGLGEGGLQVGELRPSQMGASMRKSAIMVI